jgi:two-component system sensor histidine kinase DesK
MTDRIAQRRPRRQLSSGERLGSETTAVVHTWRQLVFPAVFLVYLAQTVGGVFKHSSGAGLVIGVLLVPIFCGCYLAAMVAGRNDSRPRWFRGWYAGMLAVTAVEAIFAHQDAFVMLVYVSVLTIAAGWLRGIPIIAGYCVIAAFAPRVIWGDDVDLSTPGAIAIVSLAMYAFFAVLRSNAALAEARFQVARMATENERARIARDLHDLLGHSLTTITVKAQLAHRLSQTDPARAAAEIGEVEALTRSTLADVRAAVSGYRDVTLANELAAAREVLRAAGIAAELPGAIDAVELPDAQLFAWVVREGVTNVVRHSRASSCRVSLGQGYIEISDDGVGGAQCAGNGLAGLGERVSAAGGRLVTGSAGQRGWRLRVELPAARALG